MSQKGTAAENANFSTAANYKLSATDGSYTRPHAAINTKLSDFVARLEGVRKLKISTFTEKTDTSAQAASIAWDEFCRRIESPDVRAAKDGPLFAPAVFNPPKRLKANVTELSMLCADFDHGVVIDDIEAIARRTGYAFALHTTHSHLRVTDKNPDAAARFRLIFPLAEPIPAADFPRLFDWARRTFSGLDEQCKDVSHMYYKPAIASADAPYYYAIHEGEWLDWRPLIKPDPPPAPPRFASWADLRAELGRRIIAHESARKNERGNWDCRGICHGGEGRTGLFYDPAKNTAHCNKGCDQAAILRAFGLPEKPSLSGSAATSGTFGTDPNRDSENYEWPDIEPIPDALLPVPAMTAAMIPAALRGWVHDIAERLQVPLDFVAIPAIVAAGAVIGNRVKIQPKRHDDWTVIPNLWGAIVGRPGVMKSPAIEQALKPLRRLIKDAEAAHADAAKAWLFDKEAADVKRAAVKDQMKAAAKKGGDLEAFRTALDTEDPTEPTERRYIVNDTTIEKYGELLNQNPRGLLIFRDELTGWLRSLDDERRANDRAFFLEAWNGDGTYTYDRIMRGTLKIESTTTSILGGIQPAPLTSYLRGALGFGEGDDGLIQRFQLLVYPDPPRDWKDVDRWPNTEAKDAAYQVFKELDSITETQTLKFDDEAQVLFSEWYAALSRSLQSGEYEHAALESHFSKYRSLFPSLALIFHLCAGGGSNPIPLSAARMAAAWCEYLGEHARRVYNLGFGAVSSLARTLARKLQAGELPDGFKARELYRKHWTGMSEPKDAGRVLDYLVDVGYLRQFEIMTAGRSTAAFLINPKLKEVKL